MARYEAGETLASIARTYDCSPPAISYVVSRSRARLPGSETTPPPAPAAELQLIKASAGPHSAIGVPPLPGEARPPASSLPGERPRSEGPPAPPYPAPPYPAPPQAAPPYPAPPQAAPPYPAPPQAAPASDRHIDNRPREINGFARPDDRQRDPHPAAPPMRSALPPVPPTTGPRPTPVPPAGPLLPPGSANGDQRRTLHLSLGNGPPPNGGSPPADQRSPERHQMPDHAAPPQHGAGERPGGWPDQGPQRQPGPPDLGRYGAPPVNMPEAGRAEPPGPLGRGDGEARRPKEGAGSYIDKELRARVDGDIAAFLAAFDAALLQDTQESRTALREATDRLLRAGARTRIELERLEARMPLPARVPSGLSEPAWRYR